MAIQFINKGSKDFITTQLAYIQNQNTSTDSIQYIDTGFKPNQNSKVEMKILDTGTGGYWFGCWNTNFDNGAYAFGNDIGAMYLGYDGQGGSLIPSLPVLSGEHIIAFDKNVVKIDNETVYTFTKNTFSLNYNLYLFAQNRKGVASYREELEHSTFKMAYCKIWNNDVFVRDFIPVRANGVVCLFDKVSSKYFYNAGNGEFIGE